MSFRISTILAVLGVAVLSACSSAPAADAPTPISVEPVYTGKYN